MGRLLKCLLSFSGEPVVTIDCSFRSLGYDYPIRRSCRISESVLTLDTHCPIYYWIDYVSVQIVNNNRDFIISTPLAFFPGHHNPTSSADTGTMLVVLILQLNQDGIERSLIVN